MDNLDEELKYICNTLNMSYNLKKTNTTSKQETHISKENLEWINNFYKDDWILYNKYKQIPFKNRINYNILKALNFFSFSYVASHTVYPNVSKSV